MLALALLIAAQTPLQIKPPEERYQYEAPLTSISGLMMDDYSDGQGLAQQWARAHNLQARIMWIDGTANLDRVNSEDKIAALTKQLAETGFNTIVFDIKPISGQVLYKSMFAPKIESWRGQTLPKDFDPLPVMAREAHRNGLMLLVSLNAFSEGHNLMKTGPGFKEKDLQSVVYDAIPLLRTSTGETFSLGRPPTGSAARDVSVHFFTDPRGLRNMVPGTVVVVLSPTGVVQSVSPKGGFAGYKAGDAILAAPTSSVASLKGSGADLDGDRLAKVPVGTQITVDSQARFLRAADYPDQYPLMMDPNLTAVQDRLLNIVREVIANYQVDGLLFDDRLRFAGMDADFSPMSQSLFEKYVGQKLNWPDDVFKYTFSSTLHKGIKPGKFYDAWMLWRALQMRNWVARAREAVKSTRKSALFGIYAGSWYGEYPEFGSNYGSSSLEAGFQFLTPAYEKTGFASMLDFLITGCYYTEPTIYRAMEEGKPVGQTVEAAGQLSNRVADDQCWTVAGISLESFAGNPRGLQDVLQAACASTQGVMVFDLSHKIEPMWPVFAEAFQFRARTPMADAALLAQVRHERSLYTGYGARERPVVISAGSSGTGF